MTGPHGGSLDRGDQTETRPARSWGHRWGLGFGGALLLAAALALGAGTAPAEVKDFSKLSFEGVGLGASEDAAKSALKQRGFRESTKFPGRYIHDADPVKKRVRWKTTGDAEEKPIVSEITYTEWHPLDFWDLEAERKRLIATYGPPQQEVVETASRRQLTFYEDIGAPELEAVVEACAKEVRAKHPELEEMRVDQQALAAARYRPKNEQLDEACPGARPLYDKLAKGIEAPRLTVLVRTQQNAGRIDETLTWTRIHADAARRGR